MGFANPFQVSCYFWDTLYDITILKCYNSTMLQCHNSLILYSNVTIIRFYNVTFHVMKSKSPCAKPKTYCSDHKLTKSIIAVGIQLISTWLSATKKQVATIYSNLNPHQNNTFKKITKIVRTIFVQFVPGLKPKI